MRVCLTPEEFSALLAGNTINESGNICLDIPDSAVDRPDGPGLTVELPLTVRYGSQSTTVSQTEYALIRLVLSRGPVTYEDAIDAVWFGREISDATIRATSSHISTRFLDADIPFAVSAAGGCIAIKSAL